MFKLEETNEKIGKYLLKLITEKYQNQRKFGQACISQRGEEILAENTARMSNRLSQIIKGKNAIQLDDLPIFTELLGVSCEEILSAGRFFAPKLDRLTNYSVAFSKNEAVWETYINHPDELILNTDEYGYTALDYAFKFKNSEFLNYLINKEYGYALDAG